MTRKEKTPDMIAVAIIAAVLLVGVTLLNAPPANPQPLPPATTSSSQPDCGCGVPDSPRGPR